MQDVLSMLNRLRRPRLLIRAARIGARDYVRDRHLKRLLGNPVPVRPAAALLRLIELEGELNQRRKEDDAGYSLSRHLDLMIAMMGEAQLVAATRTPTG